MITFSANGVIMPDIDPDRTNRWVEAVVVARKKCVGEISYVFVNNEEILSINRQFLKHDYYTDVITFDYNERNIISGDIYISLDTVHSNADENSISFKEELRRVMIHGILHLCGINDKGPDERKQMEKAEDEALAMLHLF